MTGGVSAVSGPLERIRMGDDRDATSCSNRPCRFGQRSAGFGGGLDAHGEQVAVRGRDFAADDDDEVAFGREFGGLDGAVDRIVIGHDDSVEADGQRPSNQFRRRRHTVVRGGGVDVRIDAERSRASAVHTPACHR